jgi:hypothetical protein
MRPVAGKWADAVRARLVELSGTHPARAVRVRKANLASNARRQFAFVSGQMGFRKVEPAAGPTRGEAKCVGVEQHRGAIRSIGEPAVIPFETTSLVDCTV